MFEAKPMFTPPNPFCYSPIQEPTRRDDQPPQLPVSGQSYLAQSPLCVSYRIPQPPGRLHIRHAPLCSRSPHPSLTATPVYNGQVHGLDRASARAALLHDGNHTAHPPTTFFASLTAHPPPLCQPHCAPLIVIAHRILLRALHPVCGSHRTPLDTCTARHGTPFAHRARVHCTPQ